MADQMWSTCVVLCYVYGVRCGKWEEGGGGLGAGKRCDLSYNKPVFVKGKILNLAARFQWQISPFNFALKTRCVRKSVVGKGGLQVAMRRYGQNKMVSSFVNMSL